jgi:2-hydroxychromene-2-carboxylate isomerase
MYDALYGAQKNLSDRRMLELAVGLGLAGAELQRAWTAHTFIARVKEDFASGLASGVTGTPSFFINGVRHEGGWDEVSLAHAIEAALE